MLRLLARAAAAGAHGYSTLAMLLDGAPDYEADTRLLSGLKRTPELEAILTDILEDLAPLALDLVWGMEGMLQAG
ncbi:hypothetical protein HaLaN_30831 [Haematococcus lacustris]|uniref:Uncharacterized protein n=1 Tax=Haematococcus lacustris TaxID=44745 RepID=A0A6A0AHG7_HAELA|nr:hypothetical protein HaLaN_30831 [Haematococcus lacustris]